MNDEADELKSNTKNADSQEDNSSVDDQELKKENTYQATPPLTEESLDEVAEEVEEQADISEEDSSSLVQSEELAVSDNLDESPSDDNLSKLEDSDLSKLVILGGRNSDDVVVQVKEYSGADVAATLNGLIPAALEAAEASNSASEANIKTMEDLARTDTNIEKTAKSLNALFKKQLNQVKLILGGVSALFLFSLALFAFMSVQFANRVSETDAFLTALSKRIVSMNQGLEVFSELKTEIQTLAAGQLEVKLEYKNLEEKFGDSGKAFAELQKVLPEKTSSSVRSEVSVLKEDINGLKSILSTQKQDIANSSQVVDKLADRVGSMGARVEDIEALRGDVEALVTLTRQRYLELLREQVDLQKSGAGAKAVVSDIVIYEPDQ